MLSQWAGKDVLSCDDDTAAPCYISTTTTYIAARLCTSTTSLGLSTPPLRHKFPRVDISERPPSAYNDCSPVDISRRACINDRVHSPWCHLLTDHLMSLPCTVKRFTINLTTISNVCVHNIKIRHTILAVFIDIDYERRAYKEEGRSHHRWKEWRDSM